MSPTQRSLKHLRDNGYTAAIVERWNAYAKVRQDLFGFIDILAVKDEDMTLAIQTTTMDHMQERVQKVLAEPRAKVWCSSIFRKIIVHGWAKRGPRGKRKEWTLREIEIDFSTFTSTGPRAGDCQILEDAGELKSEGSHPAR